MSKKPQSDAVQRGAVIAIQNEDNRGYRQDPSDRSSRCLEHDENRKGSADEIHRAGFGSAINNLTKIQERPPQRKNRESNHEPIDCMKCLVPSRKGIQQKRQHQSDQQETTFDTPEARRS